MRISDWSSDVCSSDLSLDAASLGHARCCKQVFHSDALGVHGGLRAACQSRCHHLADSTPVQAHALGRAEVELRRTDGHSTGPAAAPPATAATGTRSGEQTSEIQSLMRTSYAVLC